jgi:ABC-2 type transport system ATP-binding protein
VSAPVQERVASLTAVLRALEDAQIAVEDVALRQPTLDDVFMRLTGEPAADGAEPEPAIATEVAA